MEGVEFGGSDADYEVGRIHVMCFCWPNLRLACTRAHGCIARALVGVGEQNVTKCCA